MTGAQRRAARRRRAYSATSGRVSSPPPALRYARPTANEPAARGNARSGRCSSIFVKPACCRRHRRPRRVPRGPQLVVFTTTGGGGQTQGRVRPRRSLVGDTVGAWQIARQGGWRNRTGSVSGAPSFFFVTRWYRQARRRRCRSSRCAASWTGSAGSALRTPGCPSPPTVLIPFQCVRSASSASVSRFPPWRAPRSSPACDSTLRISGSPTPRLPSRSIGNPCGNAAWGSAPPTVSCPPGVVCVPALRRPRRRPRSARSFLLQKLLPVPGQPSDLLGRIVQP